MKDEKSKKDEYQKALACFSEAMKEFRKSKWDKAVELFNSFIEKYAVERDLASRARTYLAIAAERLKEPREIPIPKSVEDFAAAAVYKMNGGADEEALKYVEKGLKAYPDDARILFLQADLFCRAGRMDEALDSLGKAVKGEKTYRILAQNEIDFAPLWEDKRFKSITKSA
ncbi:MAG: tetratricopeptide repeat protein [Candidatus Aminicenantes bacterium]|nr:tetratricopeptide repeat protein [Candidatus Aminicenantes bacterium]